MIELMESFLTHKSEVSHSSCIFNMTTCVCMYAYCCSFAYSYNSTQCNSIQVMLVCLPVFLFLPVFLSLHAHLQSCAICAQMVVYEAARNMIALSDLGSRELNRVISIFQLFLNSPKPTIRYAAINTLNKVECVGMCGWI